MAFFYLRFVFPTCSATFLNPVIWLADTSGSGSDDILRTCYYYQDCQKPYPHNEFSKSVSSAELYLFFSATAVFLCSTNIAVIKTFNLQKGFMEGWRLSIPFLFCLFGGVIFLLVVGLFDDGPSETENHRIHLYLILYAVGWVVSALHNRAYMQMRYGENISIPRALLLNFQIIFWMKIAAFVLWTPFIFLGALIGVLQGSTP